MLLVLLDIFFFLGWWVSFGRYIVFDIAGGGVYIIGVYYRTLFSYVYT